MQAGVQEHGCSVMVFEQLLNRSLVAPGMQAGTGGGSSQAGSWPTVSTTAWCCARALQGTPGHDVCVSSGAPGRTRTCGTRFRKPLLCPPELRGQWRHRPRLPQYTAPLLLPPRLPGAVDPPAFAGPPGRCRPEMPEEVSASLGRMATVPRAAVSLGRGAGSRRTTADTGARKNVPALFPFYPTIPRTLSRGRESTAESSVPRQAAPR
jgi:hypothetical protein